MTYERTSYDGRYALLHKSLIDLKDSCSKGLSNEGYFLYSQLYLRYEQFYSNIVIRLGELCRTFNYSKQKLHEVLAELSRLNLVCNYYERNGVLQLELIPPPPFSLMRGILLLKDNYGYGRHLALGDIFLVEGNEEFIPLKYHFIHLNNNEYNQLIEATEPGNCLYFVAETVQQDDGSWRLRNECNIMTQYPQA